MRVQLTASEPCPLSEIFHELQAKRLRDEACRKSDLRVLDPLDEVTRKAHKQRRLHKSRRQRPNADGEKAMPNKAKHAVTAGVGLNVIETWDPKKKEVALQTERRPMAPRAHSAVVLPVRNTSCRNQKTN